MPVDLKVEYDQQDAILQAAIAYKARGWHGFSPPPRTPGQRAAGAVVLIGSKQDGWIRLLTVHGPNRFERAAELALRYTQAPFADLSKT